MDFNFDLYHYESIFDPLMSGKTCLLLLLYTAWAKSLSDPMPVITGFQVTKIDYMKNTTQPEHEYLRIDVHDDTCNETKQFTLDRTAMRRLRAVTSMDEQANSMIASPEPDDVTSKKSYERLIQFVSTISSIFSATSSSESESMVEGSSSGLSATDKATLSLTETADCLSDVAGISESLTAIDRFSGQHHVNQPKFQGEVIKTLIPEGLCFFELVILAHTAHTIHSKYEYFKDQCYFYADLVFGAVAMKWPGPGDPAGSSNLSGRYKGCKVQLVEESSITDLIARYDKVRPEMFSKVFLFKSIKNYC